MNKMNFEETTKYLENMCNISVEETTKYLENMCNIRVEAFLYEDWETEENLRKQSFNLLKKMSLLRLLVIKEITNSIVVKADIEDELKRRVEDARKNND